MTDNLIEEAAKLAYVASRRRLMLTDILKAHKMSSAVTFYRDGTWKLPTCTCGATMHPNSHANHLQDAILATYPAIADQLPEADCVECGDWHIKDRMTPTLQGEWICGAYVDGPELDEAHARDRAEFDDA